jgi:CubicO group peptidase (beta-lactamase class C family)
MPELPDVLALEKLIEEKCQENHVPGGALVVVKDDQVVLMRSFGWRDVEHKLLVTPHTLFLLCSCTKAFTAMAAVMSQDAGLLSLDDSLKKYLPYLQFRDRETDSQVTLRDLLAHRTGLRAYSDFATIGGVLSREEYIRVVASAKPVARLREKYQYVNGMYSAAGEAIAAANQSTWEQGMADYIFKPLGMTGSVPSRLDVTTAADFTFGYQYLPEKEDWHRFDVPDFTTLAPAGGIFISIRDLAQWLRLMLGKGIFEGKRLVSEAGYRDLITGQMPIDETVSYCLGWVVYEGNGQQILEHNGGTAGFSSVVAFMPEQKIGYAFLANSSPTPLTNFRHGGMTFFWPWLVGPIPTATAEETPAAPPVEMSPAPEESDYSGPMTVEELLANMIAAAGGEANLRRHTSRVEKRLIDFEHQGIMAEDTLWAKAPGAQVVEQTWMALDKTLGTVRVCCDGDRAFQEASFMPRVDIAGSGLEDLRREWAFDPLLNARTLFSELRIKGMAKVDEEEVYVLEKTPEQGHRVLDYVSAATFLLHKRERHDSTVTFFSDYRIIDGQAMPFTRIEQDGNGNKIIRVQSIEFNIDIPDAIFQPPRPDPSGE